MRWTSWRPDTSLELTDTRVTLRAPEERSVSREEFDAGALHHDIVRAVSPTALVEALAIVRHGPIARCEPPLGRPQVARTVGFGRRGQIEPGYWILGRIARLSGAETRDVALAALAKDPSRADILPPPLAARLVADARLLTDLECMCGTGAETASEHGALVTLVPPMQHPDAPITAEASVARCEVCDRVWVMTHEGDDHYEWRSEMTPFVGPSGP